MVYTAHPQRLPISILLVLNIILTGVFDREGNLFFIQIFITVFAVLLLFFRYSFSIHKDYFTFQTYYLSFRISQRIISADRIKRIVCKRVGWNQKAAVIYVRNKIPLRIFLFKPDTLFIELLEFAEKNDIEVIKTKDYLFMERRDAFRAKNGMNC